MKRLLVVLLLLATPAAAADISKAPPFKALTAPVPVCSLAGCTGWHVGFDVLGSGTGVNVVNLGTLNANGTFLGIDGGYQYFDGQYWLGASVLVSYNVIGQSDIVSASMSDRLFAWEGVELGGNLFGLFGLQPPQANGFLSTITSAVPTVDIGACQHGASGYCAGATLHYLIPNTPLEIKLRYINAQYGTTNTAPGQTINNENIGLFGASYHF